MDAEWIAIFKDLSCKSMSLWGKMNWRGSDVYKNSLFLKENIYYKILQMFLSDYIYMKHTVFS